MRAVFTAHLRHGVGVFRKTGTAVPRSRIQKLPADTRIKSHTPCYFTNIRTGFFTKVGHFVNIMNFHCQKGIGSILNGFRRLAVNQQKFGLSRKRGIQFQQNVLRSVAVGADDNPVRMEKVMHGKALAQKLRQRNHVKIGRRINPADNRLDLVAGTDRNRRLGCHNRITVQITGQFLGRGINILQIGFLGNRMRRRTDCQHNHVRAADRLCHIQRKRQ